MTATLTPPETTAAAPTLEAETAPAGRRARRFAGTISREKLQEAQATVAGAIPGKTTLPVLELVRIQATAHGFHFTATNLDLTVTTVVSAEVVAEGEVLIPGRKLTELAREFAPAPVRIRALGARGAKAEAGTGEAGRVELRNGRSVFTLATLAPDEFPSVPTPGAEAPRFRVAAERLQRLVVPGAFAVATEESRPILGGVLLEVRHNTLHLVSTNGHRLVRVGTPVEGAKGRDAAGVGPHGRDLIVPPAALAQVARIFAPDETLELAVHDHHLTIRGRVTTLTTRLVEGPYPRYEQVMPKANPNTLAADKTDLVAVVKRMLVMASDQSHRLRLTLGQAGGTELGVAVQTPDLGEASDAVPARYEGAPMDVGVNGQYLLEMLKHVPGERVVLTFGSPERAVTVEPEAQAADLTFEGVQMPLRLMD